MSTNHSPFRRRMLALANGGHVRGPGSGTSDSIPARLSDGEFVLPTDTVRKVGVRRLQDLVNMTHTPSGKAPHPAQYADGGLVRRPRFDMEGWAQQQEQQRAADKQASLAAGRAAMAEADAQAQEAAAAQRTQAAAPPSAGAAPAPASQSLDQRVSQIPTDGYRPAPKPDGSQDSWRNTEVGRNLTNAVSALPGVAGAIPTIARTGGAISSGLNAASRLLNAGVGAAALGSIPGPASAQGSAAEPQMNAGRGVINPPAADPSAPPPSMAQPSAPSSMSSNNVTRVGNSYSGTNVSGDITVNGKAPGGGFMVAGGAQSGPAASPVGMSVQQAQQAGLIGERVGVNPAYDMRLTGQVAGTAQATRGQVSAQNMAAADNLAARQGQDARGRLMALASGPGSGPVEPGSFTGGYSGVIGSTSTYGNMRGRSPEQQRRDAEVSAGSIHGPTAAAGKAALAALNGMDLQGARSAGELAVANVNQQGGIVREGMQQAGEIQRAGMRTAIDQQRVGLEGVELGLKRDAAGFQSRTAQRMEKAQIDLESAKTPAEQRSARERLLALAGKAPQNEWALQVTPTTKNLDGSTTQGSVWRYNKTTGDTARVDGGQGAAASPVPSSRESLVQGQVYQTARGPARWDGGQFQLVR